MYYNGLQSTTSVTVIVRSTVNGACTLTINETGDVASGDADPSVNAGHVALTISGLAPGTLYTYSVTTPDDGGGNGSISTFKESGCETLAFSSCESNETYEPFSAILLSGAKSCINLGDESYEENIYFATTADALSATHHNNYHILCREKATKMKMARQIGYACLPDDHDCFLNDFGDDTADPPATLNAALTSHGRETMTAAQWVSCKSVMGDAIWAFTLGNTPRSSTVSGDTDPMYFAFDCGNMRVIVLALKMYAKGLICPWPNASVALMQTEQLAWFKNELNTTDKPFKVVLSQKCCHVSSGMTNSDDWDNYNDIDTILQWIHDNSSSFAVPGGVIWGSGDWHSPAIAAFENGVGSMTYDSVWVNACPAGRLADVRDPGNYLDQTNFVINPADIDNDRLWCCGIVTSAEDDSYVEIAIRLNDGSTLAKARVLAGENKLHDRKLECSL